MEGKNNSGDKLYWKETFKLEDYVAGKIDIQTTTDEKHALTDQHGHPIVYHDLFATENEYDDGTTKQLTPDGIAEAFIEFAAKERLSFF